MYVCCIYIYIYICIHIYIYIYIHINWPLPVPVVLGVAHPGAGRHELDAAAAERLRGAHGVLCITK